MHRQAHLQDVQADAAVCVDCTGQRQGACRSVSDRRRVQSARGRHSITPSPACPRQPALQAVPAGGLRAEVETYSDTIRRRLLIKQGITGLWQVSGRSDLSWEDSVRLDLDYVENWSMLRDLQIIFRTLRAVIASHGAY